METNNELRLFDGALLTGFFNARLASASSLAQRLTHADFLATSPAALGQPIIQELSVEPLVLHLDQMQRQQNRIDVGKVMDTRDYGNVVKREVMVPGYMMLYPIPFTGDPQLWLLNYGGPRLELHGARDALSAEQRILTLSLHNTSDIESSWYQKQMEEIMREIDTKIHFQTVLVNQFNLDLAEAVGRAVAKRGQQLQATGA